MSSLCKAFVIKVTAKNGDVRYINFDSFHWFSYVYERTIRSEIISNPLLLDSISDLETIQLSLPDIWSLLSKDETGGFSLQIEEVEELIGIIKGTIPRLNLQDISILEDAEYEIVPISIDSTVYDRLFAESEYQKCGLLCMLCDLQLNSEKLDEEMQRERRIVLMNNVLRGQELEEFRSSLGISQCKKEYNRFFKQLDKRLNLRHVKNLLHR